MTRPRLEVADIVRKQGDEFLDSQPGWFTFQHLKVYRVLSPHAVPTRWAGIWISALNAAIAPSRTAPAVTGIVPSVTPMPATSGSLPGRRNYSASATFTLSSRFLISSPGWHSRTSA